MKKLLGFCGLFIAILSIGVFTGCSDKNEDGYSNEGTEGQVLLSFNLKAPNLKAAALPNPEKPAAIMVSIVNSEGELVVDNEKIDLIKFGDEYVTKALTLEPAEYELTKYYVVDADNNVIYVTPKSGSPKENWVEEPLPIYFEINKDEVTKLAPEVVEIGTSSPEDFGYTTFRLNILKSFDFLIAVFDYQEKALSYELCSADLTIFGNDKVLVEKSLEALTDTISLPDNIEEFILTVEKDGYKTFTDTISNKELKLYFSPEDNGPLKVYLEKGNNLEEGDAITLITDQTELKTVTFKTKHVDGNSLEAKSIYVNWGDETAIEYLNVGVNEFSHEYSTKGVYEIKLMGNIGNLTNLIAYEVGLTHVDVSLATNIQSMNFERNNLTNIDLKDLSNLEMLLIQNNKLKSINLSGCNKLKTLQVENNELDNIDLSTNTNLTGVYINDNPLSSIDVSMLENLDRLLVSRCNLTKLDVTNNRLLNQLQCDSIKDLSSINLSNNPELEYLLLSGQNKMTSLDVSKNLKLKNLQIKYTSFTAIDISTNTVLEIFHATGSPLTDLDLKNNTLLKRIDLINTQFGPEQINNLYLSILSNIEKGGPTGGWLYFNAEEPSTPDAIQAKLDIVDQYDWVISANN